MTVWHMGEYADDDIRDAFHEDMEAQADMWLLDNDPDNYGNDWETAGMDDADAWLAAQDVPDWTA